MLRSHGRPKLSSYYESLVFARELTQQPDATFGLSTLEQLGFDGEAAGPGCIAFDPLQSLLAVGSSSGRIFLYARHGIPKCSWTIRPQQPIRQLLLKTGSPCLVAVDAKATLHIYDISDLDDKGEPVKLYSHSLRAHPTCIEYTPTLSHIFLGNDDGTVDTLDVERLTASPYRIKNLWVQQDEILRRSGVLNAPPKRRIPACCQIKSHPLDLNQLLIAYEGGIALYNLAEQQTIQTFEYLVLPGAPGGENNQTETAFLERRPACLSIAWRPDGRLFAAGYQDGSLVFWSLEDGDKPIMARTFSMEDVNLATSSSLFGDDGPSADDGRNSLRTPITKIAWSGLSGHGETILTVSGGLVPEDSKGVYCLHLPAFAAPSVLSGSNPAQLRQAYRASVKPMYTSIIPTDTMPEDFQLITSNPYFDRAQDPSAVLILLSPDRDLPQLVPHAERGWAAYAFPPGIGRDVQPLEIPFDLSLIGAESVVRAEPVTIPGFTQKRLQGEHESHALPLKGGSAPAIARQGKLITHHAILTCHLDMSIRIWDYTTPIYKIHTFSAREALSDDQLLAYLDGRLVVEKVSIGWETTEMALSISTGEVLVYRFGYSKASVLHEHQERNRSPHFTPPATMHSHTPPHLLDAQMADAAQAMNMKDEARHSRSSSGFFGRKKPVRSTSGPVSHHFAVDITDLSNYSTWSQDGFKPAFSLSAPGLRDPVTALATSDGGFIAVAWNEKLAIVDFRGPELLYNEGPSQAEHGGISLLTWCICAEGDNPERLPRLLLSHKSGFTRILTLSYTLDTWIVNSTLSTINHSSSADPVATFVLDTHGNSLHLTGGALDECLRALERAPDHPGHSGRLYTVLIIVSGSCISVFANLTGDRLQKRDFPPGAKAVAANITRKYGMPVLTVIMKDGQCVVFSLPDCNAIKTMHLSYERAPASISPDGRVLQTLSPTLLNYSTIFTEQAVPPSISHRKGVSYYDSLLPLPTAPSASFASTAASAAASYLTSWLGGDNAASKALTPTNLDDVLGGPNRPPPRVKRAPSIVTDTQGEAESSSGPGRPARARPVAASSGPASSLRGSSAQQAAMAAMQSEKVEYDRFGRVKKRNELTDALEERGEKLDFLSENMDRASKASQDFVNQARRTAMMQGAKGAVTGGAKTAFSSISKMFD